MKAKIDKNQVPAYVKKLHYKRNERWLRIAFVIYYTLEIGFRFGVLISKIVLN